jgi:hypothetical protein
VTAQRSVKPVTEPPVNGLQEVQAVYRIRTRHSRWIMVRRRRGWSRGIPVFVRRSELLSGAVSGDAS